MAWFFKGPRDAAGQLPAPPTLDEGLAAQVLLVLLIEERKKRLDAESELELAAHAIKILRAQNDELASRQAAPPTEAVH